MPSDKRRTMEIIRDMDDLRDALKMRVRIEWPDDVRLPRSWWDVAQEMQASPQTLTIVSKRRDCAVLHYMMPEGTHCLSTLMCAEHRSQIITRIKSDLKAKHRVHLVATSVVECGVDFGFPLVMRAITGLDSVAQAAGRCNREGRMNTPGRVVVFVPPSDPPPGLLRKARDTMIELMSRENWNPEDPFATEIMDTYFQSMYSRVNSCDRKGILEDLKLQMNGRQPGIEFRTADRKCEMIDASMRHPIIIPWGKGAELSRELVEYGFDRRIMRQLQRYIVTVFEGELEKIDVDVYGEGAEQVRILRDASQYSDVSGLQIFV